MPVLALGLAGIAIAAERLVEARYGMLGVVGLVLLTIGAKARNATCGSIGAVMLAMLLIDD